MKAPLSRWPMIAFCGAGTLMAAGAGCGFLAWKQDSLTLALRTIRMARANTFIADAYAVVLGFSQWSGMIDVAAFVRTYWILCALATAAYLPWLARRETQVREHHAARRRELATHKSSREWTSQ